MNENILNQIKPLPLRRAIELPDEFPLDALGPILEPAARALFDITQAPASICAQSLLAVVSLLTQGHRDTIIDGRINPTSCFFLTIAKSGDRKSAIDSIVMQEIKIYEQQMYEKYMENCKQFELEKRMYETKVKHIQKKYKNDQEKIPLELKQLGSYPSAPQLPFICVQEPTYEALFKLLQFGRPSIALSSDEGGRMLGGFSMNAENMLKTIAGLSELWDGKDISRSRAGDGFEKLYGKRFCMHLMVQPVVAEGLLENKLAGGQGFLARTLICFPASLAGTREYKKANVSHNPAILKFQTRAGEILLIPLPECECSFYLTAA